MKRFVGLLFLLCAFNAAARDIAGLKVLHLNFHLGCSKDFEEVGKELGLDVTTWYILSFDFGFFDGKTGGNHVYNITHERALNVWNKHKDYFETFDVIVTSDTAPLSRIFLQNGWKKPLLIWVCNRFDYCDGASLDGRFPDQEYYNLIRKAAHQENVRIISYTPYEYHYARKKGIEFGELTIKPIGAQYVWDENFKSAIPEYINKSETLFVYPRLPDNNVQQIISECERRGIKAFSGAYNGPNDLSDFKGVLYFPYAWSNLALFENIQRGVIHFVPSEKFILNNRHIRHVTLSEFEWVEWYAQEHRGLFVYFDSWEDLAHKVRTTDYAALKKKNIEFGAQHRPTMLNRWAQVFGEMADLLESMH